MEAVLNTQSKNQKPEKSRNFAGSPNQSIITLLKGQNNGNNNNLPNLSSINKVIQGGDRGVAKSLCHVNTKLKHNFI